MSKSKRKTVQQNSNPLLYSVLIAVIALIFCSKSINGELLNYDDERYIAGNELIESLSIGNIAEMFTSYFDGHYHPLTLLSLGIDGIFGEDTAKTHHVVNLLLHVANAILVFLVLLTLFKNNFIALGTALFFVLHPMNVESYAWMTERKNVLYSFFFLLSMLKYLKYTEDGEKQQLYLTYLFFLLSLLSKAQAVILVPTYFLIDLINNRKMMDKSVVLEKAFPLIASITFLVITSMAQGEAYDMDENTYSLVTKFFMACTGFANYLFKGFIPIELSPYYPTPRGIGASLSTFNYLSPVVLLLFLGLIPFVHSRSKKIFFGMSFFVLNLILMLKFFDVPYGDYLMANRYNYLPLIGLGLVLSVGILKLSERVDIHKNLKEILLGIVIIIMGFMTTQRIDVWNNSVSLWTDVIDQYPSYHHAYNFRALAYILENDADNAEKDFIKTVEIDPKFTSAYINLGIMEAGKRNTNRAESYFKKATEVDPENPEVFKTFSTLYIQNKRYLKALELINKAVELDPKDDEAIITKSRLLLSLKRDNEAKKVLESIQDNPEAKDMLSRLEQRSSSAFNEDVKSGDSEEQARKLIEQASVFGKKGDFNKAIELLDQALILDPFNHVGYSNRGTSYASMKNFQLALENFQKSIDIYDKEPMTYYFMGLAYKDLNDRNNACESFNKAASLGLPLRQNIKNYCGAK